MNRCLTLGLLLTIFVACVSAQYPVGRKPDKIKIPEIDDACMNCICQASSNCDETLKCHNAGQAYFCGPYVVSWAYWHDGGRPGDHGRAHDFETCLNNRTCAELAVRGYMRKYGTDCDKDGKITCDDFTRIHKLGYGACGSDSIRDTEYMKKFEICYYGYEPDNNNQYPPYPADGGYDYGDDVIEARSGVNNPN